MPDLLVFFQHALGRFNGRNNNHRHSADQPRNKEVLKDRQNIVRQEVHSWHCSPVPERNQSRTWGLLKSCSVRNIPTRAWILALLSSALQILVFPNLNLYFLCWVAMAPLLYALLRGRGGAGEMFDAEGRSLRPFTPWQGFLIAWLSGVVWYLGTCYWINPVMNGYGKLAA